MVASGHHGRVALAAIHDQDHAAPVEQLDGTGEQHLPGHVQEGDAAVGEAVDA